MSVLIGASVAIVNPPSLRYPLYAIRYPLYAIRYPLYAIRYPLYVYLLANIDVL